MTLGEFWLRESLAFAGVSGPEADRAVERIKRGNLLVSNGEIRRVAQADHVGDHCHTSAYAVFTESS